MMTVPCPGCSTPLPLAQEVCPSCRRPRGADEIELGRREAAAVYERRRALPFKILGYAALAAAAGALYANRGALLARAERLRASLDAEMEKASDPARLGRAQPAGAVAAMEGARTEASASPPAETPAAPVAAAAPPILPPASIEAPAAEPPPSPGAPANNMRRFYGVVYDLATLRPVMSANIRLSRKGGPIIATTNTNTAGHYFIDAYLDDLSQGLVLSVAAAGYREGQLEESGAPYRERDIESRERTAAETTDVELGGLLLPGGDSGTVPLDLILLAKRR